MRLPVRLKTRLDTRLPVRMGTKVETRYFRRNEGTTDYATIPEVTLTGDFVIEFDAWSDGVSELRVFGCDSAKNNRFVMRLSTNITQLVYANRENVVANVYNYTYQLDTVEKHTFKVQRIGSITTISEVSSGVILTTELLDEPLRIDILHGNGSGVVTQGILANLKIYDNGTLVRHYPLNDNGNTLIDLAGGQNGTVINGNPDDWGLFNKQPNGNWKGNGLIVPPWDSVDQILEVV